MKRTLTFLFSLVLVAVLAFNVMAQDQSSTGLAPQADGKNSQIFVQTPANPMVWNGRAFGYNAFGTPVAVGPFSFYLNNPGTLVSLGADASANFISAGSFDGSGNWWGVRYGNLQLVKIDTTTGAITQVGTVTGAASITGLAWDPTTNTMYAMNYATNSFLGTLNLTTGAFTQIGSGMTGLFIDMACSNGGQLYGVNITNDDFWSIDKTAGTATLIGSLGVAANYAQGMSWDRTVDSCYWASYTTLGELRKINHATGSNTVIGAFNCEVDALAIPGSAGPQITHTPLPNTQNLTGPYVVNCQIVPPSGNTITSAKLFWSRNNATVTDSLNLTAGSGSNYSGNIPGNGSAATYRYYLKAVDNTGKIGVAPGGAPATLYSFIATATDTTKPVITHTPLGNCPKVLWPSTVNASVTDPFGVDSVWVTWKKGASGAFKRFNLAKGSGNNWSGAFNSDTSQVVPGDVIYYRVVGRDGSNQHNVDSTAQYQFNIVNQVTVTIGTGTTSSSFPFYTLYEDARTQYLYTAAELGIPAPGGYITDIGFDVTAVGSPDMSGFTVKVQNTTLSSLTDFVASGWTTVFSPASWTPPGTGWQLIHLTTPFHHNGTGNLLIEVCYDNAAWSSNSTVNGTTAAGMHWGRRADGVTGSCTNTAWTSTTAPTTRANTRFVFEPGPTGINQLGNELPQVYSLSQNYPNPFNPSTKINFSLPKQGLVTMKIYDVLGREVKTLVNEVKAAGTYTVDFNASELSSGVYFYRLQSNGFTDIKKMMLIK